MSDYGDLCRDLRSAKSEARAKYGVACPECKRLLPKASPSILLPQQTCKIHGYRDPRPRTRDTEYMTRVDTKGPQMTTPPTQATQDSMHLDPCPFCGSTDVKHIDKNDCLFVMCENCGADMDALNIDGFDVVAAWNRRAALDAKAGQSGDEAIELAQALEQLRAEKIVEAVKVLPIGGHDKAMPTPFHAGYQLACEEIMHRLLTEEWDLCKKPKGACHSQNAESDTQPSLSLTDATQGAAAPALVGLTPNQVMAAHRLSESPSDDNNHTTGPMVFAKLLFDEFYRMSNIPGASK